MFILPHGTWKENIRSVILDCRRDLVVAQTKGRSPLVSQAKGETCWSLKQTCKRLVGVSRSLHYFTKLVLATEKNIYVNYLWLNSYDIQSSPIIFLYIYELFFVCPAVQYATQWLSFHSCKLYTKILIDEVSDWHISSKVYIE